MWKDYMHPDQFSNSTDCCSHQFIVCECFSILQLIVLDSPQGPALTVLINTIPDCFGLLKASYATHPAPNVSHTNKPLPSKFESPSAARDAQHIFCCLSK